MSSLLQSDAWGEVQAHAGWEPQRVELAEGATALVLMGGGGLRHGYVPRGPEPPSEAVIASLVDWARKAGLVRLRVEPDAGPELGGLLRHLGFAPRPDASPQQPQHSSIVALGEPEAMLGSFKPKTRYNIRLAEKRGVTVDADGDERDLAHLSGETEERQGIKLPPASYYRELLDRLPWCRVYVARHERDELAAILVARYESRAYYLFGGSSHLKRQLMPMYAAQWEAMRSAAADGLTEYDLWGVPPEGEEDHPWHGLMQFKAGFNGQYVEYAGPWEIRLSPRAALLEQLEAARGAARKLRRIL